MENLVYKARFGCWTFRQLPRVVAPAALDHPPSLILLLVVERLARSRRLRPGAFAAASVGIVAVCWMLGGWSQETQLFSQHCHLPAVFLLAGVMTVRRCGALMTAVVAVLTLAIAADNLILVREMLALLSAPPV